MNAAILLALLPALFWGSVGLISTKMGGSAAQQTLGMTFGALLFGLGTMFFFVMPRGIYLGKEIWVVGILSGLVWAVGMAFQFLMFKQMGVSIGMPLSTAAQIIMNAVMAATVLGEWINIKMWLVGIISIALVVFGATLISLPDKKSEKKAESALNGKGLLYLVISTLGFMLYFVLPNFLSKIEYIKPSIKAANNGIDYMTAIVGPQAIGQVVGALLIAILIFREQKVMFAAPTWRNILTGLTWALGNIFMFISTAAPSIGQTIATTFSQLGIIVGTFGGIYILHEKKSSGQMRNILIGTALVIIGALIIGNIHSFA
ncbi:GRP family sugar transporter [Convivina praedatoris]|uniref:Glucose uptake protein GlcU n=1 Tax=Convivina praedatoris TaxID=2880963 RepID=A0ABN8HA47_9LACO|nr:GRP family sugar transporter [Convivina sp. LMG 32447]CAH1850150.1 Glucose uptake protein GlcU [Convivina sp. LMG 32447]CAH1851031.1 Glucose uptake protein GlcU [Convivina sp. LMG 32447]CAH1851045.1 Glucose uptake protein GlcU [Convivina sp. LMG 32447]